MEFFISQLTHTQIWMEMEMPIWLGTFSIKTDICNGSLFTLDILRMKEKHLWLANLPQASKQSNTTMSITITLLSSMFTPERTNNSQVSMVNWAMSTSFLVKVPLDQLQISSIPQTYSDMKKEKVHCWKNQSKKNNQKLMWMVKYLYPVQWMKTNQKLIKS